MGKSILKRKLCVSSRLHQVDFLLEKPEMFNKPVQKKKIAILKV